LEEIKMDYIYLYAVQTRMLVRFIKSEKMLYCDAVIDKENDVHKIIFKDYVRADEIKNIPEDCFIEYVGFVSYVEGEE
jgi:hypothetical protein